MTDHPESNASSNLPPCGLYQTTLPLAGKEEEVPAGRLVYFHNHSKQGQPLLLLPATNTHNVWTFQDRGYLIHDIGFVVTLKRLPAEGLYLTQTHIHSGNAVLPERSLVQLGYNREAVPIVFPGRRAQNTIVFPDRGIRLANDAMLQTLQPVGFSVLPEVPEAPERILH